MLFYSPIALVGGVQGVLGDFLKLFAKTFHSISVRITKTDSSLAEGQDNGKGLAAIHIDHAKSPAIVNFCSNNILRIHRDKSSFVVALNDELRNVLFDFNDISSATEEISKGQARAIYIDGKRVFGLSLRVRDKCSHCVGNTSVNDPILRIFLRSANIGFQAVCGLANVIVGIKKAENQCASRSDPQ